MKPGVPQRATITNTKGAARATCSHVLDLPHGGWRHVQEVTARRTKEDFAHQMKALVSRSTTRRRRRSGWLWITLTPPYSECAVRNAFAPEEARRILSQLELHYTPKKHASCWLKMVEDGRSGVLGIGQPVYRATHRRRKDPKKRDSGVGGRAQRTKGDGRVAIHSGRCTGEAQAAIPIINTVVDY